MRAVRFTLLVAATMLFALACSQPSTETTNRAQPSTSAPAPATSTPDQFAVARATYLKNCLACHSEDGSGGVKEIDGKKLKVPSLKEGHSLKHTNEDFIKQIEDGGDGMPQFKDKLSPVEISDLVRLIRHEFQGDIAQFTYPPYTIYH